MNTGSRWESASKQKPNASTAHLVALQFVILVSPSIARDFRQAYPADPLGHLAALCHQHINRPQLRNDLFSCMPPLLIPRPRTTLQGGRLQRGQIRPALQISEKIAFLSCWDADVASPFLALKRPTTWIWRRNFVRLLLIR
jgi:hypothetical protein